MLSRHGLWRAGQVNGALFRFFKYHSYIHPQNAYYQHGNATANEYNYHKRTPTRDQALLRTPKEKAENIQSFQEREEQESTAPHQREPQRCEGKREHSIRCQPQHLSEGVLGLPSKAGGRPVRKDDGSKSDPRHHDPEAAFIFRHLPQSSVGISWQQSLIGSP